MRATQIVEDLARELVLTIRANDDAHPGTFVRLGLAHLTSGPSSFRKRSTRDRSRPSINAVHIASSRTDPAPEASRCLRMRYLEARAQHASIFDPNSWN